MTDRKLAILNALDDVLAAYDEWADDKSDYRINPDSALADHLELLETTVDNGAIPQQCLTLVVAIGKLMTAYRRYTDGEWCPHSLEPTERFYAAIREVQTARIEAAPPQATLLESVANLRCTEVSYKQIARMHGVLNRRTGLWEGPFFTNGRPDTKLIDQESAYPQSVLEEGWVHPRETARLEQYEADMKDRLHRIDSRANGVKATSERRAVRPSEDEVVAYLDEGAFPRMAFRRWRDSGITLAEIMDISERHNIVPSSKEQPTAPADRMDVEDAGLMEPQKTVDTATYSPELLKTRVLELHSKDRKPAEIRAAVQTEFGQKFSPQKIAAIVRESAADEPATVG